MTHKKGMVFLYLLTLPLMVAYGQEKALIYEDYIYEKDIKTVLFFPANDPTGSALAPPVLPIIQDVPLILKFDEVNVEDHNTYMAKIIHCNADWTPSGMSDMQYMNEYNEFYVNNYDFSLATKVPYTHYTFAVPRVRLPGNYLLMIYRDYNEKDLIITRRFFIFDNRVIVRGHQSLSTGVTQRLENHQINFIIDYSKFPIPNPYLDIKVAIRQNFRWDNQIYDIRPSMIREDISQLVYEHFTFENNFKAGNEFRFFDMRSIRYSGQNIERIMTYDHGSDAFLYIDKPRNKSVYSHLRDMNGAYLIQNSESPEADLESDYAKVHFFLEIENQKDRDIFLAGKLTDWRFDEQNRMKYMEASGLYACSLLLKQGYYDYCYYIPEAENPYMIEGSYSETRNDYDVIVYFRDQMLNADVIIGYIRF